MMIKGLIVKPGTETPWWHRTSVLEDLCVPGVSPVDLLDPGRRVRVSRGFLPGLGQQLFTKFEIFQYIGTGDSILAQVISPVGGRKQRRGKRNPHH